ncbi:MAG TPA: hypothetical protein GXZ20_06590 [Halanaerobiaceae bacterium]|nr:hypothetical protein [Halanaerobiaceae bacterium]
MMDFMERHNKFFLSLLIALILFVSTTPVYANIIPIRDLEKAEIMLYGQASENAILQKIDTLELAIFGETKKGSLVERAEGIIEFVLGKEDGLSLLLLINIMDWTLFNRISAGNIMERIENLELNIFGQLQTGSLFNRVERLSNLLIPQDGLLANKVLVLKDEEIHIRLLEEINTAELEPGQSIKFKIDSNYKVNDYLIIPAGTEGSLTITNIKKAGRFGQDASLTIRINDIKAIDGSSIPLNLKLEEKGNYSEEIAIGVGLLSTIIVSNPVGLVAGYFYKGKDIVIPAGTVLKTQVLDTVEVYSIKLQ